MCSVIRGVQPDIVMVELCKARTNILHLDEETILEVRQYMNTRVCWGYRDTFYYWGLACHTFLTRRHRTWILRKVWKLSAVKVQCRG